MIPAELIKKIRRIQIRTSHLVSDLFAGHYHSAFKGQGMEFQEVREYVAGDEIRSIDWNVTARMGHPYVKKFIEERELTVMLLVDISASHQFGGTEQFKKDLAAEISDKTVANAIKNGISERYDSISGKKLGVEYLGMTCTVITMMLDGLCSKHKLQLRKT